MLSLEGGVEGLPQYLSVQAIITMWVRRPRAGAFAGACLSSCALKVEMVVVGVDLHTCDGMASRESEIRCCLSRASFPRIHSYVKLVRNQTWFVVDS